MTIRLRLTLWFASVLIASLLGMGLLSYYELVVEPRNNRLLGKTRGNGSNSDGPAEEIGEAAAWCAVPALVFGLGGGWLLMRRTLAPIAKLTLAAEAINENHLAERLQRSGNGDELDRLTEVFNAMTERLQRSFARIREFTLHASHELKTPLTVMHAELENALQSDEGSAETRVRLESQIDEVQRLTRIVDSLALLTRADSGLVPLVCENVSLDQLVQEACADTINLGSQKNIQVSLCACPSLVVRGDRDRLRQLLLTLSDNAVKYNTYQGIVTFDLSQASDEAEIRITNTGPGIPPESLPRIFDPFFRGDPSHSKEVDGCGLGLSIARWIVKAHEGELNITSVPGQVTTAIIRLPLLVPADNSISRAR